MFPYQAIIAWFTQKSNVKVAKQVQVSPIRTIATCLDFWLSLGGKGSEGPMSQEEQVQQQKF